MGTIPIPIWPVKIVLVVGFVLFALQVLASIIELLDKRPGTTDDSDD